MARSSPQATDEQIHPWVIEIGLTAASEAATQSAPHRNHARAKALHACATAERQMREAIARGWAVEELWAGLQELRAAVAALDQQERKGG